MIEVNEDKCAGCGLCVAYCPADAIRVWGLCNIDRALCTDCLICLDYCPTEALVTAA